MNERLTAEDWAAAALDAIADGGLAAVAVEPLARVLGVTKGSFYWHFASRDALIGAAIERWERLHAAAVSPDRPDDPQAQLAALVHEAIAFATKRSVHARLVHETGDPRVAAALERITAARLIRLAAIYRRLGLTPAAARARGAAAYATVVGLAQLHEQGALDGIGRAALERATLAAVTPP